MGIEIEERVNGQNGQANGNENENGNENAVLSSYLKHDGVERAFLLTILWMTLNKCKILIGHHTFAIFNCKSIKKGKESEAGHGPL